MTYSTIDCQTWADNGCSIPQYGLWKIENCPDGVVLWYLDGVTYSPPFDL